MIFNWFIRFYYDKKSFTLLSKTKTRNLFLTDEEYDNGFIRKEKLLRKYDLKITENSFIVEGFESVFGVHEFIKLKVL